MAALIRKGSVSAVVVLGGLGVAAVWFSTPRPARAAQVDSAEVPTVRATSAPAEAVARAAALVEGRVTRITFSYDEQVGPRVNAIFDVEKLHAGADPGDTIEIRQFGGFLPGGRITGATGIPALTEQRRYLLLLAAGNYFWTPVIADYSFAIENVQGREVLVDEGGHLVVEISLLGPRSGADVLFEPPHFDGRTFPAPEYLGGATQEVEKALRVSDAVGALLAAASSDGVTFVGLLGGLKPRWYPWNVLPLSPPEVRDE